MKAWRVALSSVAGDLCRPHGSRCLRPSRPRPDRPRLGCRDSRGPNGPRLGITPIGLVTNERSARHDTSNQIIRFNAAMTTDVDLTGFEALSFDCYGTLIDWETGITAVLAPWAREQALDLTDEDLLLAYADNEAAVERETPSARYPEVLAAAFRRTGHGLGRPVTDEWAQRLGDSVPDWPAFPDSSDALARLATHYRLIILSNVHRDGFAASNQRLKGDFAAVVTADDVGAYKPAENHFRALDTTLRELGIDRTAPAPRRPEPVPRSHPGQAPRAALRVDQPASRSPRLGCHPRTVGGMELRPRIHVDGRLRRHRRPSLQQRQQLTETRSGARNILRSQTHAHRIGAPHYSRTAAHGETSSSTDLRAVSSRT